MGKFHTLLFLLSLTFVSWGQEVTLPVDLRQHNLTEYNSSLFHPAFSLTQNNSQSIALWTRWQWQTVDADPTTLFFNYSRKLNDNSTIGAAFFQHNTGLFLNTGGLLNYAYSIDLGTKAKLAFGVNLFGFKQKLSNNRFQPDPQIQLPQLVVTDDFILQLSPGVMFSMDRFSLGFASENLFDYNFTTSKRHSTSDERIYMGMAAYDFPISFLSFDEAVLRPSMYVKSTPGHSSQIGINTLLSTDKFWSQVGYNTFYGVSVGAGGRFFKRFSIGALVEFGTDTDLKGKDPSFELVTAYSFGSRDKSIEVIEPEIEEDPKVEEEDVTLKEEQDRLLEERAEIINDSLDMVKKKEEALALENQKEIQRKTAEEEKTKKEEALAKTRKEAEQRKLDSLNKVKEAQALAAAKRLARKKTLDSLTRIRIAEAEATKKKKALDSLTQIRIAETESAKKKKALEKVKVEEEDPADKPKANEKYEEVASADGLEPGYYLITNVFGTKKYFDAFMKDLTKKGLEPKSFYRSKNKYNYVYLKRYNTMSEARKARDSKFDGRYPDKTWIFRVRGK